MDNELLCKHLQALAIHFVSYKGPLPALAGFVKHSMGEFAPPISLIEIALRRESIQKELIDWEVSLFSDTRGLFHLVNVSPERDVEIARRRLNSFPVNTSSCRWCRADSRTLSHLELVPELDIHGHPVHRSRLHRGGCMRAWLLMRDLVEHADKKVS